ncbi:glycosyltransferase family 2 protein [Desulfofustis limnaeus]|uniref:Glycosyl transferase family 2 n=1 Tax=Desulfofustis limnaeus TaxID=2740163 RepID=A0ABN6M3Z1_9BACT|nr:glycosyltransferase family 2 protein [Desulfofustis limnaeus]BDD87608.1 glycosyl transferase family 2 [Desulfofustis limnaeus]
MQDIKSNSNKDELISIVVPVFNEKDVLLEFHKRLSNVLNTIAYRSEILYVNDGSTDCTINVLNNISQEDQRVRLYHLSRNFGKEIALTAGLDNAKGEAIIVIDADLQDPPELIHDMLKEWEEGYQVVYAKRIAREGETILKRSTAFLFYRIIKYFSKITIPQDTGDFRLLSREPLDSLLLLRERNRFMKGLFAWIGFSQKEILYRRDSRFAGKSKWDYVKLWNFAIDGITSFTVAPLKISSYLGLMIAFGAFLYGIFVIAKTLIYGDPVPGYPSLMVVILFLGGIQLICIGIIGEYLGRMFTETKQRPLYIIKRSKKP